MVSDREVKLSGDALYEAAATQIRAGLGKDFPQGWQFKAEISVKPQAAPVDATVCQQLFADLLTKARIRFESGRADISQDSLGLLDRLIETALRCPNANIEIAGHTDADGDQNANQTLSEKRAQAVADYLVRAGLPASRFAAGRLWQHPAARQQRYRRRQGAEPPHRFRGEIAMTYLATFFWGWLLASPLLGFAMGWIAVVHRGPRLEAAGARFGAGGALVAVALARVVPGRYGYWLDLGLIMFALIWSAARSDRGCATGWSRAACRRREAR